MGSNRNSFGSTNNKSNATLPKQSARQAGRIPSGKNEEQGSNRMRRLSSGNMGPQNALQRRRSPTGKEAPVATTIKESDGIKKKLDKFQQDVISICQEYDAIVAKQVKSRTDYL